MIKLIYQIVKKRNDSVIKKSLSIFIAGICLLSSVSTPTFAGENESTKPVKTFDPYSKQHKDICKKKLIARKAFLTALLCAADIDVYIKFQKDRVEKNLNFTVVGTESGFIEGLGKNNNILQIETLMKILKEKKDILDFSCDSRYKGRALNCVRINSCLLTQTDINKIGERVLDLIYEKKKTAISSHNIFDLVNLRKDASFKQEATNIFKGVLNPPPQYGHESPLKFYKLSFDTSPREKEPITNVNHLNYMKKYPEDSYSVISCYHKAFFIALLSAIGIDVRIKENNNIDCGFRDCFFLCGINEKTISAKTMRSTSMHTENIINIAKSTLPKDKFKVETLHMVYTVPTKVKIGNITLSEIDIFNLGQRFYNLVEKTMSYITTNYPSIKIINLDKILSFTKNVKKEFKDYTGQDLPDIKL